MNENILNEILTTLKDFREENNKRWEENEIRFKKIEAKQAKLEYLEKQQESIIYQQNIHTEQIEKILEKVAIQ